jgi:hypothetical protein
VQLTFLPGSSVLNSKKSKPLSTGNCQHDDLADKEPILEANFAICWSEERLQINAFFPLEPEILSELRGGETFPQGISLCR